MCVCARVRACVCVCVIKSACVGGWVGVCDGGGAGQSSDLRVFLIGTGQCPLKGGDGRDRVFLPSAH